MHVHIFESLQLEGSYVGDLLYLEKRVSGREKDNCKCPEPGTCLRSPIKIKEASR